MNDEQQPRRAGGWLAAAIVCALLLALLAFVVFRSRSTHALQTPLIRVDSNGTTRLGPLPLRNTNLRDAAFTAVGHLNKGTAAVSAAESARMSDILETMQAMQRAGITSLTLRAEPSLSSNRTTNK